MSRSRLHREWRGIRERTGVVSCSNPAAIKHYIDRGIGVCDEWESFRPFAAWALANGYEDDLSIDRIDSDKGYEPDNCRWVTMTENLRSRKDRKLTMEKANEIRRRVKEGEKQVSLAREFGIAAGTVWQVCKGQRWAS